MDIEQVILQGYAVTGSPAQRLITQGYERFAATFTGPPPHMASGRGSWEAPASRGHAEQPEGHGQRY